MFNALVFDQATARWRRFTKPLDVLVANTPAEVLPVLDELEARTASGLHAVGFVSYEAASAMDPVLACHKPAHLPLAAFALFREGAPAEITGEPVALDLSTQLSRGDFDEGVSRIRTYLAAGDTYQVNYTHRWRGQVKGRPEDVFAALWRSQASELATFIETDTYAICSVSPELFFELDGDRIRCEPMKGTRPRGRTESEDNRLRNELASSAKDRAENLMIVDMIRNDLGRIADTGSVRPERMFDIVGYPTIWSQVSSVTAKTSAAMGDIFRALFPCASVTGAPRRRTMEIIRELENSPRGVYTGAIGYVAPGRRARFSVAIRTLVIDKADSSAEYGVGGGIVWNSGASEEWQECQAKASILAGDTPDFRLLETFKTDNEGRVFLQDLHLARLARSARFFGYHYEKEQVVEKLADAGQPDCRLRLLLDRSGNVEIESAPLPDAWSPRVCLASSPVRSDDIYLYHKTTHRKVYEDALKQAPGFDDVILWNERGELTETTICNLFLEIDGELLTPTLESGLLPGTYRQHLLDQGIAREARLVIADLDRATRIFLGNSLRGLTPTKS